MKVTVVYVTGATTVVTTEVPDDADTDTIDAIAAQEMGGTLCHACSHQLTVGDFDLHLIEGPDGEELYSAPDPGPAAVEGFRTALVAALLGAESQAMGLGPDSGDWLGAMADFVADFEPRD